jgi:hypothetical protein
VVVARDVLYAFIMLFSAWRVFCSTVCSAAVEEADWWYSSPVVVFCSVV